MVGVNGLAYRCQLIDAVLPASGGGTALFIDRDGVGGAGLHSVDARGRGVGLCWVRPPALPRMHRPDIKRMKQSTPSPGLHTQGRGQTPQESFR